MQERFDIGFEFANDWGEIATFLRGSDILVSSTRAYNRIRQCLDRRAMSGHDLVEYAGDVPPIVRSGGIPLQHASVIAIDHLLGD